MFPKKGESNCSPANQLRGPCKFLAINNLITNGSKG